MMLRPCKRSVSAGFRFGFCGRFEGLVIDHEHPGVQDRAVEAVFGVQLALPLDHMREQVAEERGVLGQQRFQIERALSGDELVEPDLARRYAGPVLGALVTMVRIWAAVAYGFEDHQSS